VKGGGEIKAMSNPDSGVKTPLAAQNAKTRLIHGLQVLTKGILNRESLEYTYSEEGNKTTATVKVNVLDPPQSFTGKAVLGTDKKSKTAADMAAAEACLKALDDQIKPAVEAAAAAKKEKKEEQKAIMMEKFKEKKAAEKAEKAAKREAAGETGEEPPAKKAKGLA